MKLICFIFIFLLLIINPSFANNQPENPKHACVIVSYSNRTSEDSTTFTFLNSCAEKIYINACVTNSNETKFYKSFKAVPPGGTFTIYSFPEMNLDNLQYLADIVDPGIPPLCLLPKN